MYRHQENVERLFFSAAFSFVECIVPHTGMIFGDWLIFSSSSSTVQIQYTTLVYVCVGLLSLSSLQLIIAICVVVAIIITVIVGELYF